MSRIVECPTCKSVAQATHGLGEIKYRPIGQPFTESDLAEVARRAAAESQAFRPEYTDDPETIAAEVVRDFLKDREAR